MRLLILVLSSFRPNYAIAVEFELNKVRKYVFILSCSERISESLKISALQFSGI